MDTENWSTVAWTTGPVTFDWIGTFWAFLNLISKIYEGLKDSVGDSVANEFARGDSIGDSIANL
jgi:hypothetical protein